MIANKIKTIPIIFSTVILSLNTVTPIIAATNGSTVARIDALPASTFSRPFVYKIKGKIVH